MASKEPVLVGGGTVIALVLFEYLLEAEKIIAKQIKIFP